MSAPSFASAFMRASGPDVIARLRAMMTTSPVVLIAGDQLTGKTTAAQAVAAQLVGPGLGTGSVVRSLAAQRGMSIEAFSAALKDEPATDIGVDLRAAEIIARGDAAAFESRLAGHLGAFLRGLGRKNLTSIYLSCAPRKRALRYVLRTFGAEARERIEPQLDVASDADLATCLRALGRIDDPAARAPIFHPWHTTVDTIWRNWQLCEAAWRPDDYDWESL